jgi:hypothetical protein
MKVRFGTIWLAPGGIESTSGFSINGQQINDPIQFYRATSTLFRPRGQRSDAIAFVSERKFNSVAEAERFLATFFSDLPEQADLYLFCGDDAEQIVVYEDAVINNVARSSRGVSVTLQFNLSAGLPQTDTPAPDVTEPDADMIKRGTPAITSGEDSIDVTFTTPFATTPVVVVAIQSPDGGDVIAARVRDGSVTTDGFTADLSAPAPASGYKLPYIACA